MKTFNFQEVHSDHNLWRIDDDNNMSQEGNSLKVNCTNNVKLNTASETLDILADSDLALKQRVPIKVNS